MTTETATKECWFLGGPAHLTRKTVCVVDNTVEIAQVIYRRQDIVRPSGTDEGAALFICDQYTNLLDANECRFLTRLMLYGEYSLFWECEATVSKYLPDWIAHGNGNGRRSLAVRLAVADVRFFTTLWDVALRHRLL